MMRFFSFILIIIYFSGFRVEAHEKPLFQWGAMVGHGMLAAYPASDQYRYLTLPFPYVSYQGDIFLTDDEDGTRFRLIRNENFDFDLSFGGSFTTSGEHINARQGMPNLDWTFELGPRLLYYFYKNPRVGNIRVGIPVRASFATDFTFIRHVGYLFCPTFQIDKYNFLTDKLDLFFMLTMNSFDRGEADFFFGVDPKYQTPERPAYEAQGGYFDWEASLSAKYQWSNKMFLVGAQYADHSGAKNDTSPLFRSRINQSYFVGFGWVFGKIDSLSAD